MSWRYGGGTLARNLDTARTGGMNPAAGFRVVGINLRASRKVCECKCHKYVPKKGRVSTAEKDGD